MNDTYFIDTNVLIYAQDPRDPNKQQVANKLVRSAIETGRGVVSSQVAQEYCNVATSKFEKKITGSDLEDILRTILKRLWRHSPSIEFYQRAVSLHIANSLSFYDALIVQAAIDVGCQTLYSEDLQAGRTYGGVTIKNPFKNK